LKGRDKIAGMLGLAERAGKLVSGESKTLEAVRSGKALICIVAADASDNTRKLFHDKCGFNNVPVFEYGTKISLGHASMAVCDENFAKGINRLLTDLEGKIES